MADKVGPFRTDATLRSAMSAISLLKQEIGEVPLCSATAFDPAMVDWLNLRNMLLVAQSVAQAALARTESRGAHQREDYPGLEEDWCVNQIISLSQGDISLRKVAPITGRAAA